jgi:CheY-like chemotaxis protein
LLIAVGFSVRCSDDGEAAIREWREWSPRLILMDMHGPVMAGLEATRRIKAASNGSETEIVILAASVLDEDRRNVCQGGANHLLAKPYREDEPLSKVNTLLNISYDYEEIGIEDQPYGLIAAYGAESPTPVTAVRREMIEELRDATSSGGKQLLKRLIANASQTENAEFAHDLPNLSGQYKYDALRRLLAEACC